MDPNSWSAKWRSAAAYVYLLICLSDFMLIPMYYEFLNHKVQTAEFVGLALKFDGSASQIEALKAIRQTRVWQPLTLQSTGLFHVAFGGILGVVAWKGKEKISVANEPNTNTENPKV